MSYARLTSLLPIPEGLVGKLAGKIRM